MVAFVPSMSVQIREADLDCDGDRIAEALSKYLKPVVNNQRFEWLYRKSPHGSARAWLAFTSFGEVIGSAAAFPRQVYADGCEETAWVFGDFCLSERYRSVGPALQLQKACLKAAETSGVKFWYDFPSASMLAVYRRLELPPSAKLLRLAKLLRVDREVAKIIPSAFVHRAICPPANHFLSFCDGVSRRESRANYSLHTEPFGAEFSRFASENRLTDGIVVRRDAEYLNWRYFRNPLYQHEVVVARCEGALVGYAIFFQSGRDATLVDLFNPGDVNVLFGLVDWTVTYLRERGTLVLSVPIVESHPFAALLTSRGFKIRESSAVVIQNRSSLREEGKFQGRTRWLLMAGDRDS